MDSQIEKLQRIKEVRSLQYIQSDIENCLLKYIFTNNKLQIITNELNKIIIDKFGYSPDIIVNYDKFSYTFMIKMHNVGLEINITNEGYEF
jgi:hypothetical protein